MRDAGTGIVVLLEGEEEVGSPNIEWLLERVGEIATPDLALIADGDAVDGSRPYLTTSLRGLLDCTIEVRTLTEPVHAGQFGGIVPDALTALVRILPSLVHEDGRVAIAGLVRLPPTDAWPGIEQEAVQSVLLPGVDEIGRGAMADRLLCQPSVAVVAIDSPPVDVAARSLADHARALISLRLVPGDEPAKALTALAEHVEAVRPWGVHVELKSVASAMPFVSGLNSEISKSVIRSIKRVWSAGPVNLGSGASIPCASRIASAFPDAASLITGVADLSSNAHGPNESVDLDLWRKAALAEAMAIADLG